MHFFSLGLILAPLFTDHAVLQRDRPVPIWGRANPGEKLSIEFAGRRQETAADPQGRWSATLAPMAATGIGSDLVVQGSTKVTLHDIVVGDVWLCAGQSNMEFPLRRDQAGPAEVAAAHDPLIRQLRIEYAVADAPVETAPTSGWHAASPATAASFTAVGYYFAQELRREIGIPIGLLDNARGGSPIESWLSAEVLSSDRAFAPVAERWKHELAEYPKRKPVYDAALAAWAKHPIGTEPPPPKGPGHYWQPSGLYNAMLNPLFPAAIRGVLWYQGESNVEHASEYRVQLAALVTSWRGAFRQPALPFIWVQLPNYIYPTDKTGMTFAWLREAQAQALELSGTSQAVTIDVGDPNNVHPTDKKDVGHRLALIAENRIYGRRREDSGPVVAAATREGSGYRVRFVHSEGLKARQTPVEGFVLAGADRVFHPAQARIEGVTVRVWSPAIPQPEAIRYAWSNSPSADLCNDADLPAAPFRSDRW